MCVCVGGWGGGGGGGGGEPLNGLGDVRHIGPAALGLLAEYLRVRLLAVRVWVFYMVVREGACATQQFLEKLLTERLPVNCKQSSSDLPFLHGGTENACANSSCLQRYDDSRHGEYLRKLMF